MVSLIIHLNLSSSPLFKILLTFIFILLSFILPSGILPSGQSHFFIWTNYLSLFVVQLCSRAVMQLCGFAVMS